MTFAHDIAQWRRDLHLTQAELAALLHVDKQSVSNWECGRNEPWDATKHDIYIKLRRLRRRASINERILGP